MVENNNVQCWKHKILVDIIPLPDNETFILCSECDREEVEAIMAEAGVYDD